MAGITSLRSVASAVSDAVLVPSPCIGMFTISTVLSGDVRVVTGPDIWPVAIALSVIVLISAWIFGAVTSSALTTTVAGSGPPGNAAWMRS